MQELSDKGINGWVGGGQYIYQSAIEWHVQILCFQNQKVCDKICGRICEEQYTKNKIPAYLIPNVDYLSHRIKSYVIYIAIV